MKDYPSPLYAWQEMYGEPEWRFQTDQPDIKKKLSNRKGFHLVAEGANCRLWVYRKSYLKPKSARRALERISGRKIEFDARKGIYFASNVTTVRQKKEVANAI